jgi:predicted RNase H-like nuclease (RuvC/YqgF family)
MDRIEAPLQAGEDIHNFSTDPLPQANTTIQMEIEPEPLTIHQMFEVLCNDMKHIKQELQDYKQEIKTLKTSNDFLSQKIMRLEAQTNQ